MEAATGVALEASFLADWTARYLEAWNSHDPDGLAALCTDDLTWHDPGLLEPARGRAGIRAFAEDTFVAFPDFRVEGLDEPGVVPGEPVAFSRYRFQGTMTGPWKALGLAPTGRRFAIDGVDEWRFRDGLLCHYAAYYNALDMARQLGALPPVGSATDRLLGRLQPLQARFQRRRSPAR